MENHSKTVTVRHDSDVMTPRLSQSTTAHDNRKDCNPHVLVSLPAAETETLAGLQSGL